jgi:hypothetical protein
VCSSDLIRSIIHDTEFAVIQSRSHQICFLARCARETLRYEASVSGLAKTFQANVTTLRRTFLRAPEDLATRGRHAAIDDNSEAAIIASVLESFQTGKPLTRKQLLDVVHKEYNPRLTKGWLNACIGRHLDQMKVCRSLPQEDARLIVPRAYLEAHIALMRTHVTG